MIKGKESISKRRVSRAGSDTALYREGCAFASIYGETQEHFPELSAGGWGCWGQEQGREAHGR